MSHYAAVFIDYENLYVTLKNIVMPTVRCTDALNTLFKNLKSKCEDELSAKVIVQNAYADFDNIEDEAQRALLLAGIEPVFALGTSHKNAADMRLSVDAVSTLYQRKEIETFVIAAGDRDFIPVVCHLIQAGKRVRVLSFQASLSGDLRQIVGDRDIWTADSLLDDKTRESIGEKDRQVRVRIAEQDVERERTALVNAELAAPVKKDLPELIAPTHAQFEDVTEWDDPYLDEVLQHLIGKFGYMSEIWMNPARNYVSNEMPFLSREQINEYVDDLVNCGAISWEYNQVGPEQKPFSRLNWNHPAVRKFNLA